jgi:hypothetical protein
MVLRGRLMEKFRFFTAFYHLSELRSREDLIIAIIEHLDYSMYVVHAAGGSFLHNPTSFKGWTSPDSLVQGIDIELQSSYPDSFFLPLIIRWPACPPARDESLGRTHSRIIERERLDASAAPHTTLRSRLGSL